MEAREIPASQTAGKALERMGSGNTPWDVRDNRDDSFAAAWLGQWRTHGGTAIIEPDGRCCLGHLDKPDAPDLGGDDLPGFIRESRNAFSDGLHHGRMRGLLDLLEAVPGGLAEVKAFVAREAGQ